MTDVHDGIDLDATASRFAPAEGVDVEAKSKMSLLPDGGSTASAAQRELMEHLGFRLREFRQAALIRPWRDVEEHWDNPAKGHAIRALEVWRLESDESGRGLSHSGASI